MEHILYWLWLTTKYRIANSKITRLFERFDSIEDIYLLKSFNNIYGISEKDRLLLMDKDLSKAKLAYALNMPVDNIELVQMSTEEFITSKADAADSYDLIYIGGNKSALKPSTDYTRYPLWYIETNTYNSTAVFSMFAHTGGIMLLTRAES